MLLGEPLMDVLLSDRSLCTALPDAFLLVPDGRAEHSNDRRFNTVGTRVEMKRARRGRDKSDMIGRDQVDEASELLASIGCQVVHCLALPLRNYKQAQAGPPTANRLNYLDRCKIVTGTRRGFRSTPHSFGSSQATTAPRRAISRPIAVAASKHCHCRAMTYS
jgi:hypothetical protein